MVIPTYGRAAKLAACVRALAGQEDATFEVLVGLDGADPEAEAAAKNTWDAGPRGCALRVAPCERSGLNPVRNELLKIARGEVLISINDDVLPAPGFVAAHVEAHRSAGRRAVVPGFSPFLVPGDDSLFDRLCRETSMIFFYDRMDDADPGRDWGFRHCFGLNFSAPMDAVRAVGGFTAFPMLYGYDDIELAWRLRERFGMPVLYRPAAVAEHDHRYGPPEVLSREVKLGRAAWHFAEVNAAFTREVFGRDIRSREELAYSREFVKRERKGAAAAWGLFRGLNGIPAGAVDGAWSKELTALLYQQHLPLKRWAWRVGLLDAAEGGGALAAGDVIACLEADRAGGR